MAQADSATDVAGHQLQASHDPVLARPTTDVLESIPHPAARQPAKSLERERRSCPVARESFATQIVPRFDPDAGMHVEPVSLHRADEPLGPRLAVVVFRLVVVVRQGRDCATAHGDVRARVEGGLRRRLV